METSLPYHYQDYQQPYSCGFFFQQKDTTYNTHAYQYPEHHPGLVDWHSPSHYLSLHGLSSSRPTRTKLSPCLRFHMPAYRYSQPQRAGWRGRRGRPAVHTITNMSPPSLTRCVSTLSSPFIADRQLTGTHYTSSYLSSSHAAADLACVVSAGQPASYDACSTHPNYLNTSTMSAHGFLKWLDCSLLDHPDQDVPVSGSDHICRSLIDTSHRPSALNDAICMYIDYLSRDNDRVIGEFSTVNGDRPQDATFSTMVNDQLYRDVFCQPSSFPTSRFREWLQLYSVDLEITDPDGRKLTEATFPGCGCKAHQVADRPMNDLTSYRSNQSLSTSQNTGVSWSQSDLGVAAVTVPRLPVLYRRSAHEMCDTRGRRGRGRCARRPGRGRGARRKSESEYNALSYHKSTGQRQKLTDDVPCASLSTVDTECDDDSDVVEFLASLQSDAVKRRCRQQELESQQVNSHDVESQGQDKVIEEVVDDEFQVDDSGVARCQDHQKQVVTAEPINILPESYMNGTKPHFTNEPFLAVSFPAVGDRCCSVPVKVVNVDDPGDVVGKSSEQ